MPDAARAAEFAGWGHRLRALGLKGKLLLAGGLLALGLLALWLSLPGLLAARWTAQLRTLGFPQAELAIDDLGLTRATGAFSLGQEDGADGFVAHYSLAGLWSGQITGLEVQGLRLSRPLSATMPDLPALTFPVQIHQARLTLALPGGIGAVPLDMDATINPVEGGWHAEGQGILTVEATGLPARLAVDWRGNDLSAASFTLTPAAGGPRLSGQGSIRRLSTGGWTGDLDVTAKTLPQGLPDMVVRWKAGQGQALLEWPGIARLDALLDPDETGGQRLAATVRVDDLSGFAARLGQPEPGLTGGPVTLALSARNIAPDLPPRTWPYVTVRLDAAGLGIGKGPRDNVLALSGTARRIDGEWWLSPASDQPPGSLSIPTLGLSAKGLLLTGRIAWPLDLDVRAAALRLPWLAPATLAAKLRGDPENDLRLEWSMATTEGGASLTGSVEMNAGGGRALARLAPLRLEPGDAPRLFPGTPLPDALTGTIAARLTAAWTGDSADGTADILLEDAGLRLPGLRLAGVNGVLRFDRLSPLSMPPQTLAIGLFDPGIALTGGGLGLSLPADGVVRLAPEPFRWAGQFVTLPQSSYRLGQDHLTLRLDIPATPLPDALRALGVTDLDAEGNVIGSIPVRIDANGASTGPDGLQATGPGRIAMRGDGTPSWLDPARNDSLALVARALAGYRFSRLGLFFSEQGPGLTLDGTNPSLYGGYPMPMNLILSHPPPAIPAGTPSATVAADIAAFKARKD